MTADELVVAGDRWAPVTSRIGFLRAPLDDVADQLLTWRRQIQDFEDTDAYQRRKIADRFTADMLAAYAAALDLDPWNLEFYPGPSVSITNPAVPPRPDWTLTIAQTQQRSGIAVPD